MKTPLPSSINSLPWVKKPVTQRALRLHVCLCFLARGRNIRAWRAPFMKLFRFIAIAVERMCAAVKNDPRFGIDLRDYLLWSEENSSAGFDALAARMAATNIAQPTIVVAEIALCALLNEHGVYPSSVVGHSVGEISAAYAAQMLSMEDAALFGAARGAAMNAQPPGAMLAIMAPYDEVAQHLSAGVSLAAQNAPMACVVSGKAKKIEGLKAQFETMGLKSKIIPTSHAFHSPMMDGARANIEALVAQLNWQQASAEIFSTNLGGQIQADEFSTPAYWGAQLLNPVLFSSAAIASAQPDNAIMLEVGPGGALSNFVRQSLKNEAKRECISVVGGAPKGADHSASLFLKSLGSIWAVGGRPIWQALHDGARRRVALPTYPFERKSFWIEPTRNTAQTAARAAQSKSAGSSEASAGKPQAGQNTDPLTNLVEEQLALISEQLNIIRQNR